jgi:hypothetical protein
MHVKLTKYCFAGGAQPEEILVSGSDDEEESQEEGEDNDQSEEESSEENVRFVKFCHYYFLRLNNKKSFQRVVFQNLARLINIHNTIIILILLKAHNSTIKTGFKKTLPLLLIAR